MTRKVFLAVGLFLASSLMSANSARAGIISEFLAPDISAAYIGADYDSTSDLLKLQGSAITLEHPENVLQNIYKGSGSGRAGSFSLDAYIDGSGLFSAGSFEIKGTLDKNDSSVTLLKGTITEAYTEVFEDEHKLEFRASIDSGSLAYLFESLPNGIGIRVHGLKGSSGFSFANSFDTGWSYPATADIGREAPEPGSIVIFASAFAIGCCGVRRRRKNPVASTV